jgi:hypothetical protein
MREMPWRFVADSMGIIGKYRQICEDFVVDYSKIYLYVLQNLEVSCAQLAVFHCAIVSVFRMP